MANINSLMTNSSSSTSSLYGTRNVLSGLASGMDTEAMIENSVSGYKAKITQLEQQQTKYQWKQDAYRSITDKMYALNDKYTSYTSKTNLYSNAFFTSSATTSVVATGVAGAANVDKVSATGKSSSSIEILAAQTAAAARYSVSVSSLAVNNPGSAAQSPIQASGSVTVGTLKGYMTLSYASQNINISFDEIEDNNITDAASLQSAIRDKLSQVNVTTSAGVKKASDVISVRVEGENGEIGAISFTENSGYGGSTPFISYIDNNLQSKMNVSSTTVGNKSGFAINSVTNTAQSPLQREVSKAEYLNGREVSVTLDGVAKTFKLSGLASSNPTASVADQTLDLSTLVASLQDGIDKSFGANKVEVKADGGKLSFDIKNASSAFAVSTKDAKVGTALGIGKEGLTSYLNTDSSLRTLLGGSFDFYDASRAAQPGSGVSMTAETDKPGFYKGDDGNRYEEVSAGNYRRVDDDGNYLYELKINGESVYVSKESSLQSVLNDINNSDMGVKASYSRLTGKFVFEATETGAASGISFDNDLAQKLFYADGNGNAAGVLTRGSDAKIVANVNGESVMLTRSSNTIDMDGLSVNIKEGFGTIDASADAAANAAANASEAVSFKTSADADSITKTIKEFLDEYNAILKEVHDAYATRPAEKSASSHSKYEPLTDDDKAGMSDKAVENYEAKAKQGLLFGDTDLSALYSRMSSAFSTGANVGALKDIGITTTYSGGVTQIKLNEGKLRAALESDPDKVRETFTQSKEGGAAYDGLMTSVKKTMEQYASTSIGNPGVLVKKAGSTFSSSSLLKNTVQTQIDNVQKQIEQWQSKMSSKIDYYTRQFTALEKLMNTMNSQSSALSGLMGGY